MRVLIVGAGLLGATTAYFLRRQGADVSVVDRAEGPGLGASFANGALLHPSLVDPWNSPGVLGELLGSIGRRDAAMLLRLHALPSLLGWGLRFVAHSTAARFHEATSRNARLANYSMEVLRDLRTSTGIEYAQWSPGSLQIFRDRRPFESAVARLDALASRGIQGRALSRDEVVELEPRLASVRERLVGGVYYAGDEGGDAHRYCREVTKAAAALGVTFDWNVDVRRFVMRRGAVAGVLCGAGLRSADVYVLAAGAQSQPLARSAGLDLSIRPVKGYSLTLPRIAGDGAPRMPIIDHGMHVAIVPVGRDRLRVVGTAEFAGFNLRVDPARIRNLTSTLVDTFPAFAQGVDLQAGTAWAGLRPVTSDGCPVLGATRVENLFVNSGHGHLGWTLAAGSARLVADAVCGVSPVLDLGAFSADRFKVQRRGRNRRPSGAEPKCNGAEQR